MRPGTHRGSEEGKRFREIRNWGRNTEQEKAELKRVGIRYVVGDGGGCRKFGEMDRTGSWPIAGARAGRSGKSCGITV